MPGPGYGMMQTHTFKSETSYAVLRRQVQLVDTFTLLYLVSRRGKGEGTAWKNGPLAADTHKIPCTTSQPRLLSSTHSGTAAVIVVR